MEPLIESSLHTTFILTFMFFDVNCNHKAEKYQLTQYRWQRSLFKYLQNIQCMDSLEWTKINKNEK